MLGGQNTVRRNVIFHGHCSEAQSKTEGGGTVTRVSTEQRFLLGCGLFA